METVKRENRTMSKKVSRTIWVALSCLALITAQSYGAWITVFEEDFNDMTVGASLQEDDGWTFVGATPAGGLTTEVVDDNGDRRLRVRSENKDTQSSDAKDFVHGPAFDFQGGPLTHNTEFSLTFNPTQDHTQAAGGKIGIGFRDSSDPTYGGLKFGVILAASTDSRDLIFVNVGDWTDPDDDGAGQDVSGFDTFTVPAIETVILNYDGAGNAQLITVNPDGSQAYDSGWKTLASRDDSTLEAFSVDSIFISDNSNWFATRTFEGTIDNLQVSAIPEPGTLALLGIAGLAGLAVLRRRRI